MSKFTARITNRNLSTFGKVLELKKSGDCEGVNLYKAVNCDGYYCLDDKERELLNAYTINEFAITTRK